MPDWISSQTLPPFVSQLWQRLLLLLPVSRLRQLALVLLSVWILSMLADVFWQLIPEPQGVAVAPWLISHNAGLATGVQKSSEKPKVDVQKMQSWQLFGQSEVLISEQPIQAVNDDDLADAKETRLQIKLLGLMQSSGDDSYAILESGGQSGLFRVGETLPIGQNIKLSRVLIDRVIIDNRGSLESLLLYDENEKNKTNSNVQVNRSKSTSQVLDQRQNSRITQMASAYRKQLLENPMSMMEVIRMTIAKDSNGNIVGYRISPGRDRKQFAEFGLQNGDIVTAVNGVSLEDPSNAMDIYSQMRTAKEAALAIKRGNQDISIIVNLSE